MTTAPRKEREMKKILVIDIGGTHVKLMISRTKKRKFDSGKKLSPRALVRQIKECTDGLGVRCDFARFSFAHSRRPHSERSKASRSRLGRFQFQEGVRQTDAHHQRRGHAGARQLRWKTDALSRSRHRSWFHSHLGQQCFAARVRRSSLSPASIASKRSLAKRAWNDWAGSVGKKKSSMLCRN